MFLPFRKAVASVARRLRAASSPDDWFFGVFQPDRVIDPANGSSYAI